MKVALFKSRRVHKHWTNNLARYLASKGHSLHVVTNDPDPQTFDACVIWNGCRPRDKKVQASFLECSKPVCFMEVGFFPQRSFYMLSRNGSVAGDLFSGEEIPDLPPGGEEWLREKFKAYSGGVEWTGGDQVSGFLQLEHDHSVVYHSRFAHMQQFIEEAQFLYPDDKVIFKVHPLKRRVYVRPKHPLYRGATIWPHVARAKLCIAINSTALFEAAWAGCPVRALGNSPLARHPDKHREIVHEILLRQIPVGRTDVDEQVIRSVGPMFE